MYKWSLFPFNYAKSKGHFTSVVLESLLYTGAKDTDPRCFLANDPRLDAAAHWMLLKIGSF